MVQGDKMTILLNRTLLAVLGVTLALGGCSKEDKSAQDKQAANGQVPAKVDPEPRGKADPPAGAEHFASVIMISYEKCRSLLASDTTEGIDSCTAGIIAAAGGAHARAPEAAHEPIAAVEKAAEALAAAPADDIEAVRKSFGELSKSVMAMLQAAPEVAAHYHIFECPMAKGYGRWAQPDSELANPYMGSSMLTCGSEIK
jgi:hypothetical protein